MFDVLMLAFAPNPVVGIGSALLFVLWVCKDHVLCQRNVVQLQYLGSSKF